MEKQNWCFQLYQRPGRDDGLWDLGPYHSLPSPEAIGLLLPKLCRSQSGSLVWPERGC